MAQETFTFALNMTTNTPAITQVVISALESLRKQMGLTQTALNVSGEGAQIDKFVKSIETAMASGATLESVLKKVSAAYAQLAADAPRFAAGLDISALGRSLEAGAGVTRAQFDTIRAGMEDSRRGASDLANAGVAAFEKLDRSILRSNEAIEKALLLYNRLKLAAKSVGDESTLRPRENAQQFLTRAGGITTGTTKAGRLKVTTDDSALEEAVARFGERLNLRPVITKLNSFARELRAAAIAIENAGDPNTARRFNAMAAGLATHVTNLQAQQGLISSETEKTAATIRTAQDVIAKGMVSMDRAIGQSGEKYLKAVNKVLNNLAGAARGPAVDAAITHARLLAQQAKDDIRAGGPLPVATRVGLESSVEDAMASVLTAIGQGFQGRAAGLMKQGQGAINEANRSATQAEKEYTATKVESAKATATLNERLRLLTDQEKRTAAQAAAARRAQAAQDVSTITTAKPDFRASQRAADAFQSNLARAQDAYTRFGRATSDSARLTALTAMKDALDGAHVAQARYTTTVAAAGQALQGVSPAGRMTREYQAMDAQMARAAANVGQLTSSTGSLATLLAQATVAQATYQAELQATEALKRARTSDTVLLAEQGRRMNELVSASGKAETALGRVADTLKRTAGATDEQLVKIYDTAQRQFQRFGQFQQQATTALGAAQGIQGALPPAVSGTAQGQTRAAVLAEAQQRLIRIEAERIAVENQLAAAYQKANTAARNLATAAGEVGQGLGSFFTQFKRGFVGARQPPEQLGVTARTTLYYGVGYRILGQMEQIATRAFQTLQDFQVGLVELGDVLELGEQQTRDYGKAVLQAATDTGAAADDVLKGVQRLAVVFSAGQTPTQQEFQGGEFATSLGQLSRVSGETAESLARLTIATGQSYEMTGNVVSALGDLDTFVTKRFGLAAGDVLKSIGQVAELGQAAGFTVEELAAFSAQIQSSTGQTSDAVAGYLSQILGRAGESSITGKLAGVGVDITKPFADQMKELAALFQSGVISDAVAKDISNAFGRGRVGNAMLTFLKNAATIQGVAGEATTGAAGSLEERFGKFIDTIGGKLTAVGSQFEMLIVQLGEFGQTLALALEALNLFLKAVNAIVGVYADLNNVSGGAIGWLLAGVTALKLFQVAVTAASSSMAKFSGSMLAAALGQKGRAGLTTAFAGGAAGVIKGGGGRGAMGLAGSAAALRAAPSALLGAIFSPVGIAVAGAAAGVLALKSAADKLKASVEATTDSISALADKEASPEQMLEALQPERIDEALAKSKDRLREGVGGFFSNILADEGALKNRLKANVTLLGYAKELTDADEAIQKAALTAGGGGSIEALANKIVQSGAGITTAEGWQSEFDNLTSSGLAATTAIEALDLALRKLNQGASDVGLNKFIAGLAETTAAMLNSDEAMADLTDQVEEDRLKRFRSGTGGVGGAVTPNIQDSLDILTKALSNKKAVEQGFADITELVTTGVINLADGLQAEELDKAWEAFSANLDLKGVAPDVLEQFKGLWLDQITVAFGALEDQAREQSKGWQSSAEAIAKSIMEAANASRVKNARTPLFGTRSGSAPGVKALVQRLGALDQQIADAVAENNQPKIDALTAQRQQAGDAVMQELDKQQAMIEQAFAGREKTPAAIKALADNLIQKLIAAGGDVNQMIAILGQTSTQVARAAVAGLRAQLKTASTAFAAANEILKSAITEAQTKLKAMYANLLGGKDIKGQARGDPTQVHGFTQKWLNIPQEEFDKLDKATQDAITSFRSLDAAGAQLDNIGDAFIGGIDEISGTAEKGAKTASAAQIAAARALAEATRTSSRVAIAAAQLQQAQADLAVAESNTVEYWNALAQVYQAQDGLAAALREVADTARRSGSDLTNPIEQAQLDLELATAAVQDAVNRGKAVDEVQRLQLEERSAANALEETKFREFLSQLDTNRELGRITDEQRIAALEAEKARLSAIIDRTYQQQQMLDEVEKALKSAASELDAQFNLGDIKLPTVYQVRRYIQTMTAGLDFLGSSLNDILNAKPVGAPPPGVVARAPLQGQGATQTVVNNQIRIDGADVGMVKRVIIGTLGASEAGRSTTIMRKF